MAIRPPKSSSEGFTLVEMLVVLIITGVVMGLAIPSLLALNKPLRDGTLQFKSHLSLIRSKAISRNQAYRIRPKYATIAEYPAPNAQNPDLHTAHSFIVEFAPNCQVSTSGKSAADPTGASSWQIASDLDLDLPYFIGVVSPATPLVQTVDASADPVLALSPTVSVTAKPTLNWNICYDNRGAASETVDLALQDYQANNQAVFSVIRVGIVGGSDISTYNKDKTQLPPDRGNTVF